MNQAAYRKLISGQDCRFAAILLRACLYVVSVPYATAVWIRNIFYNTGVLRTYVLPVPVISIGNITTGGTGKTPLVIWLCRYLGEKKLKCAVLTRGYKTPADGVPDEPALLAKSCPDVQVIVNPDRLAGGQKAIEQFQSQVIVLDDGYQHRRIERQLNILAVDATCPFGCEKLLPAGLLREPLRELRRADAVIITRFDLASPEQIAEIENRVRRIAGDIPVAHAAHRHTHAVSLSGKTLTLEEIRRKKLYVYCGIGNPQAFINCLTADGMTIVGSRFFNDHHNYTQPDMKSIAEAAVQSGAEVAVCTQKDWVKTAVLCRQIQGIPFCSLTMELDFVSGADIIKSIIDKTITNPVV